MIELPKGVVPVTGLLVAMASHQSVAAGGNDPQILRLQPGAGFAIGLHGFLTQVSGGTGADAEGWDWNLDSDPDQIITNNVRPSVFYTDTADHEGTSTTGQDMAGHHSLYHNGPLLVVQDVVSIFGPTITANSMTVRIFYAVYAVSDTDFVRLAAINLARRG